MPDFEIVLSGDDVEVSDMSTLVDLPFCVRAGDKYFPHEQWTDVANDVLPWWVENFLRNRWAITPEYRFQFMEGPYRMDARQDGDELFLTGISERGINRITEFEITLPVSEFLRELLRAFRKLRKIVYGSDAFEDERTRQIVLESVDHYTEILEKTLTDI